MPDFEFIIVGLGIAGASLAWQLESLGADVLAIDRGEPATASRVAAGLMTPVTGMRLVKTWRFDELRNAAWEFYERVEAISGQRFLYSGPMIRLLNSPDEVEYSLRRCADPEYAELLGPVEISPASIRSPQGAIELRGGGQLDVPTFLRVTRERLSAKNRLLTASVSWDRVQLIAGGVELPEIDRHCRTLIFADGAAARTNPFFPPNQFNATRGEILTVEIPEWNEERVIHGPVWIAPRRSASSSDMYQIGATYDWSDLDSGPSIAGRETLEAKLRSMLERPFRVVDHVAAVRPILRQPYPVAGRSSVHPQLAYWNGLASKGSLQAPLFARQLASHLVHGTPLDPEIDWQSRATDD